MHQRASPTDVGGGRLTRGSWDAGRLGRPFGLAATIQPPLVLTISVDDEQREVDAFYAAAHVP
jgi:hypothetical protein